MRDQLNGSFCICCWLHVKLYLDISEKNRSFQCCMFYYFFELRQRPGLGLKPHIRVFLVLFRAIRGDRLQALSMTMCSCFGFLECVWFIPLVLCLLIWEFEMLWKLLMFGVFVFECFSWLLVIFWNWIDELNFWPDSEPKNSIFGSVFGVWCWRLNWKLHKILIAWFCYMSAFCLVVPYAVYLHCSYFMVL